jgi:tetratricopeptide (TPR) repeat protein
MFRLAPAVLLAALTPAHGIDVLQTSRTTYRGTVFRADAETVTIDLENGNRIGVPRKSITRSQVAPRPEVLRGTELFRQGKTQEAYDTLGKVMPRYLGLSDDWAARGMVSYARAATALGQYKEAEQAFRSFETVHPRHPLKLEAFLGRAQIRLAREEYEVAHQALTELSARFEKSLKPVPERMRLAAETLLGAAKAAEGLERWEDARTAYLKVVTLYPHPSTYEEALFRSALVRTRLGELEGAAGALDELIGEFPENRYKEKALTLRQRLETELRDNGSA